jgi:rSAM/selenodomain-associated transferase 1
MSADRDRHNLVIFARRPAYGVGKRRLAAQVGELAALRFQRLALAKLLRELRRDPRWKTWVAVTPDRPTKWVRGSGCVAQGRGDLGERLSRVGRRLPRGPLVILGSDAPQVRRTDVATAFRMLGRCEAVFGPAVDGGYWLVGLSEGARTRPPFSNVRWSTAHALGDTLNNLQGRCVGFLRELEDVDDAGSLERLWSSDRR